MWDMCVWIRMNDAATRNKLDTKSATASLWFGGSVPRNEKLERTGM